MSEEKHNLQRQADRARSSHKRSLTGYLLILFAAALVLLLFAYLMQQRSTNEQTLNGIQQSISAIQSAQEAYEENSRLKEELSSLENELSKMKEQISQAEEQLGQIQGNFDHQSEEITALQQQITDLQKSNQAMDWFWQINEAFVRGRHTSCKELINRLNSAGLTEFLPRESITANGRFSPYDRYQEIYDALN